MNKQVVINGLVLTTLVSAIVGCSDPTDKVTDIDFSNFSEIPKILEFEFSDGKKILFAARNNKYSHRNAYIFTNSHLCSGDMSVKKNENGNNVFNITAPAEQCEPSEINPYSNKSDLTIESVNVSFEQKSLGDIRVIDSDIAIKRIYKSEKLWNFAIPFRDFFDYESYARNVPRSFHSNTNNKTYDITFITNYSYDFSQLSIEEPVSCDKNFFFSFFGRFNTIGDLRVCKLSELSKNTYMYKDKSSKRFVFIHSGIRYDEVPDDWVVYTDSDVIKR